MSASLATALTPAAWPVPQAARMAPPSDDLNLVGPTITYHRDQEIHGEGEPAEYVYKVVRGAVRAFRILADGRRQISDFYLPGDCFGLEAGLTYRTSAEALIDTQVIVVRRGSLTDGALEDSDLARRLWRLAVGDLQRSQDHVLMLGRRSAAERVASFLMDLADRMKAGTRLELPMSRQDIADYLGLTIETVSRTLTQFQESGLIEVPSCRSIRLPDLRAMAELCE